MKERKDGQVGHRLQFTKQPWAHLSLAAELNHNSPSIDEQWHHFPFRCSGWLVGSLQAQGEALALPPISSSIGFDFYHFYPEVSARLLLSCRNLDTSYAMWIHGSLIRPLLPMQLARAPPVRRNAP